MLELVPYLQARNGVPVADVARDFGVPTGQIIKDLNVLWFCGLPNSVTGDMIDVDMNALEDDGFRPFERGSPGAKRSRHVQVTLGDRPQECHRRDRPDYERQQLEHDADSEEGDRWRRQRPRAPPGRGRTCRG